MSRHLNNIRPLRPKQRQREQRTRPAPFDWQQPGNEPEPWSEFGRQAVRGLLRRGASGQRIQPKDFAELLSLLDHPSNA